jgi:hypothetical protein
MRGSSITCVACVAIASACLAAMATVAAQTAVQRSTTFDWTKLEAKSTPVGMRRDVMRAPTPTLDELEMHITTLNPGARRRQPITSSNGRFARRVDHRRTE